ncbi:MAG TPA: hypothetical protein DC054_09560 [Blastocatellia bacterium]|nr:hypothetical protein [Blastocatellia bacterium]
MECGGLTPLWIVGSSAFRRNLSKLKPRKRGTPNRKRRQAGALQFPCLTLNQIIPAGPVSVVIAAR